MDTKKVGKKVSKLDVNKKINFNESIKVFKTTKEVYSFTTDLEKSILVIEDNIEKRIMLKYFFCKKGFKTETTGTGKDALIKLRNRFFNVILLTGTEGTESVLCYKEMYPDIGIIIITNYPETTGIFSTLENKPFCYLIKSVNFGEILDKVKDIIKKQRLTIIRNKLIEIFQPS